MTNKTVILRFDDYASSDKYALRRITGTVTAQSMIKLIGIADLNANPREAKVGDITDEIQETLDKTPQLYPFKSKGILLAAGQCASLDRNRFQLSFTDEPIQGVLDGGHNLLAVALFTMRKMIGQDIAKQLRSVRRWDQVQNLWAEHKEKIEASKIDLTFLTPIEVIYPHDGAAGLDEFEDAILDVARARNNNAQLTDETKANKAGLYEGLRSALDPSLVNQVEWKTNDGGRIKAREFIALSWIALSKLDKSIVGDTPFNPVNIYRNKGACVTVFNKLMAQDNVSEKTHGDIRVINNPNVLSALSLMKDLPRLYDEVYQAFPKAYNDVSPGFGRISSVYVWDSKKADSKDPKYLSKPPVTRFYQQECLFDFPDGFVMPVLWALRELMFVVNGRVKWKVDPSAFLKKNLVKTLKVYHGMIQMASYDPQKVGKTGASYELIANDFRSRLLEQ